MFYSPLRYPGGKNCLFKFITNLFYDNDLVGIEYAEPYAGGAGLALRLLFDAYVSHVYINDLDISVYAFWREILDNPDQFCDWLGNVQVTMENWHYYRDIQNNSSTADMSLLARAFFFLNRTNVSGIIKGGVIGGSSQIGQYKMDVRFNRMDLISRIKRISQMRDNISVSNLDGLAFIDQLTSSGRQTFIYLDPPYVKKGSELYMNYYKPEDHAKLSAKIRSVNSPWIVSYDNSELIIKLYNDVRKINYQIAQSTSNRVGNEVLIFSKTLDFERSMNSLRNPSCIYTSLG